MDGPAQIIVVGAVPVVRLDMPMPPSFRRKGGRKRAREEMRRQLEVLLFGQRLRRGMCYIFSGAAWGLWRDGRGRIRRRDVHNLITYLADDACDILGIDDSQFWGVIAEKDSVQRGSREWMSLTIYEIPSL